MSTRKRNALRSYEGANLLFFLIFILALGLFVAWFMRSFKSPNAVDPVDFSKDPGIVAELDTAGPDTHIFYVGTKLTESSRRCTNPLEIPVMDDGLFRDLLAISGVVEVTVDQRMVTLQKAPSASWPGIKREARAIINRHLHMHP